MDIESDCIWKLLLGVDSEEDLLSKSEVFSFSSADNVRAFLDMVDINCRCCCSYIALLLKGFPADEASDG